MSKLGVLVAYYPTALPKTSTGFPPNLKVVVHIAGDQNLSSKKYPTYHYPNAEVGFAETDYETFDKISANLAWSRTLSTVRRGFGVEADLESLWEKHLAGIRLSLISLLDGSF